MAHEFAVNLTYLIRCLISCVSLDVCFPLVRNAQIEICKVVGVMLDLDSHDRRIRCDSDKQPTIARIAVHTQSISCFAFRILLLVLTLI